MRVHEVDGPLQVGHVEAFGRQVLVNRQADGVNAVIDNGWSLQLDQGDVVHVEGTKALIVLVDNDLIYLDLKGNL